MRKRMIFAVLPGLLGTLTLSGTAEAAAPATAAYPVKDTPALTANPLYKSGKMDEMDCPQGALSIASTRAAKTTLQALWKCMNEAWEKHLEGMGVTFEAPKLRILTKPRRFCGHAWGKDDLSWYCDATRTAAILVGKTYLKPPVNYNFQLAAGIYAYHVQNLTGIADAYDDLDYNGKSELAEQIRRDSLQSDCLGGVFLGAVWKTAGRKAGSWKSLLDVMKQNGDEGEKLRYYGKGKNIARWLDRGFTSRDPGSCNTWKATPQQVA